MKPAFTTPRLALRAVRASDAALLLALDRDPEVRRYVDQPDEPTLELMETVVARMRAIDAATPQHGFWMAEFEGEFVGWFQLKPPRPGEPAEEGDLEVGYRLMRRVWGRGLATEGSRAMLEYAFRTLRAPRATAVALRENRASTRVMEKLGMTPWREWDYRSRSGAMLPSVTYALVSGATA